MNIAIYSPNWKGNAVMAHPLAIVWERVAAIYEQHPAVADLTGSLDGNASGLNPDILIEQGA